MRHPPKEQRRIGAYLDGLQAKMGALKKLQTETAAELDALLPSVLDMAFNGELELPAGQKSDSRQGGRIEEFLL